MKILVHLALLVLLASAQTAQDDLVDPASINYPADVNFQIYSGYFDIWQNGSQLIHYVFLTSQNNPATDPLLFWTNGGPGCSSQLGWVQENGPFLFKGTNTTYYDNLANSWNLKANVLYMENPPGVGYSVNNITNFYYSDENSGVSNFLALQAFFARFPEYVNRPFWLSGESYAGVYIPFMLEEIRQNNLDPANGTVTVNVKGFLIGNNVFVMDEDMLNTYLTNQYVAQQFLDYNEKQQYYANCFGKPNSPKCQFVQNTLNSVTQNTDPYFIYGYNYGYRKPNSVDSGIPIVSRQGQALYLHRAANKQQLLKMIKTVNGHARTRLNAVPETPDDVMIQYFTNPNIMKALHVYDTIAAYKNIKLYTWQPCSNIVGARYHRANDSTQLYPNFLKAGYQILIYNGNSDAVVPFQYSRACITNLFNNFDVKVAPGQPWSLWQPIPSQQLGGWSQSWVNLQLNEGAPANNFTFAVVRGAGHEVPEYQPEASYYMLERFMNGQPL